MAKGAERLSVSDHLKSLIAATIRILYKKEENSSGGESSCAHLNFPALNTAIFLIYIYWHQIVNTITIMKHQKQINTIKREGLSRKLAAKLKIAKTQLLIKTFLRTEERRS